MPSFCYKRAWIYNHQRLAIYEQYTRSNNYSNVVVITDICVLCKYVKILWTKCHIAPCTSGNLRHIPPSAYVYTWSTITSDTRLSLCSIKVIDFYIYSLINHSPTYRSIHWDNAAFYTITLIMTPRMATMAFAWMMRIIRVHLTVNKLASNSASDYLLVTVA